MLLMWLSLLLLLMLLSVTAASCVDHPPPAITAADVANVTQADAIAAADAIVGACVTGEGEIVAEASAVDDSVVRCFCCR